MLISMTGFGSATTRENGYAISTEIRSVNNRYLKTSIKLPDGFARLETRVDEQLRRAITRGSVYFSLKLERETLDDEVEINFAALARYMREARAFLAGSGSEFSGAPLGSVVEYLRLPGVIGDKRSSERESLPDRLWDAIARNVDEALENLQAMRRAEGESTRSYLASILDELRERIAGVKELAPTMVESYRERVSERVAKALAEVGAELNPGDVAREIAIYTDRVDISEEIARFESHVAQFDAAMKNESSVGKKLDFLTQEMFRETNTIGSKASSPEILQRVVEMKSAIERAREMVQNVE